MNVACVSQKQSYSIIWFLAQLNLHSDGGKKKEGNVTILQIMINDILKTNGFHKEKQKALIL